MKTELFKFVAGPHDGETIAIPSPAPARITISESGTLINVSGRSIFPCYVKFILKAADVVIRCYEYEGEPRARA